MSDALQEIFSKLRSDRLWALVAFIALVVVNAMFGLGLEAPEAAEGTAPLVMAMWATVAFILGKSVRSTTGGTLFGPLLEQLLGSVAVLAQNKIPGVPAEDATDPYPPAE